MFRPCIDLHNGKVKQIVGGTLESDQLETNFVSEKCSAWYAELFQKDNLKGGHVIMLGKGNQDACLEALRAYPRGLQAGGGITPANAEKFLHAGASHIIVTSYLFDGNNFSWERLKEISSLVGKDRLVVDLSCLYKNNNYYAAINRWQTITDLALSRELLEKISSFCDEFLIHAVGVEGLKQGMDKRLIRLLAEWSPIAVTYAGGARDIQDLYLVEEAGRGKIHLTIGSALDIFGGSGVRYEEAVDFNRSILSSGS